MYMVHMLQLLAWFCCIICLLYYFLGDFQCLSECFVSLCSNYPNFYVLTIHIINWQLEHTWQSCVISSVISNGSSRSNAHYFCTHSLSGYLLFSEYSLLSAYLLAVTCYRHMLKIL